MNLDAEAGVEIVGQHPLGEVARIEQAVLGAARAGGSLAKGGRENQSGGFGFETVAANEIAGVLVILTRGENELQFVARREGGEILQAETQVLAAAWALDVHDLVDLARDEFQWTLAAGFQQKFVAAGKKLLHEGDQLALLQHGLAAGDLDEAAFR